MVDGDLHARDLEVDDIAALLGVRTRSFGPVPATRVSSVRTELTRFVDDRRALGVFAGDQLVAGAQWWAFDQWWCGRTVPMAGVAGVVVDPAYRGQGVATRLMRALLGRVARRGVPLSALYPATLPVYRKLGYELAGGRYRFSFSADALRRLDAGGARSVAVRRAGPDDAQRLLDLVAAVRGVGRESGPLGWPLEEVRTWLADEETLAYLAGGGFVVYRWADRDLEVDELVARDAATARALWSLVGSGASVTPRVHAWVAPHDPIHHVVGEEADTATRIQRWMLRLVDAPAAVSARGWPSETELEVPLTIADDELPDNDGSWRLRIESGNGELERAGADPARFPLPSRRSCWARTARARRLSQRQARGCACSNARRRRSAETWV